MFNRHKGNLIRHMSAHDPLSTAHEKALALKLGRQKKIQIIDGQQVEVMPGEEEDEDEADETDATGEDNGLEGSVMAVEGCDGQQYVVLEVIQLQVRLIYSIMISCFFYFYILKEFLCRNNY